MSKELLPVSEEEMPMFVGALTKQLGINGFHMADLGHPVFELKDRYIIYLESKTPIKIEGHGVETTYQHFKVCVPYYKKTLEPFIHFMQP